MEWIDINERVPDDNRYVLLSFANAFDVPDIGRYEGNEDGGNFYLRDDDTPLIKYAIHVNAWMELPKRYEG